MLVLATALKLPYEQLGKATSCSDAGKAAYDKRKF